jgi:predicted lipoprotein with Yx(FWY)xxD motif
MLSRLSLALALTGLALLPTGAAAGAGQRPPGADQSASASAPAGPAAATPRRAVLRLRKTRFGKVIHEKRSGLVAYLFTKERSAKPACYGACAKAWPPIKTRGRPRAGRGLARRHLGTTRRRGGARMATYRGHPLYFYEHDRPGEILCNDVLEFGGRWFVVDRRGRPAAN